MRTKVISVLVILIAVAAGIWFFAQTGEKETAKTTPGKYQSIDNKISFSYPTSLYLKELTAVGDDKILPISSVVLVEDNQFNRDLLDGKVQATKPPSTIIIDVYRNQNELTAEEWGKENSRWLAGKKETESISVGGQEGFLFNWKGLYDGKSVVATNGALAYVLSVSWQSPDDILIKSFDDVLQSLAFTNSN